MAAFQLARRRCRQAAEQYSTPSQLAAHLRRQLIGRPQARQGLLGKAALLPRKLR